MHARVGKRVNWARGDRAGQGREGRYRVGLWKLKQAGHNWNLKHTSRHVGGQKHGAQYNVGTDLGSSAAQPRFISFLRCLRVVRCVFWDLRYNRAALVQRTGLRTLPITVSSLLSPCRPCAILRTAALCFGYSYVCVMQWHGGRGPKAPRLSPQAAYHRIGACRPLSAPPGCGSAPLAGGSCICTCAAHTFLWNARALRLLVARCGYMTHLSARFGGVRPFPHYLS